MTSSVFPVNDDETLIVTSDEGEDISDTVIEATVMVLPVAQDILIVEASGSADVAVQTLDSVLVDEAVGVEIVVAAERGLAGPSGPKGDKGDKGDTGAGGAIDDDTISLNTTWSSSKIDSELDGKSDTSHNHDSSYYTESEVDTLLTGKSDTSHHHDGSYDALGTAASVMAGHLLAPDPHPDYMTVADGDDRYYTEEEMDTFLSGKSGTSHEHAGIYEPANNNIQSHISSSLNPHSVTAAQTGAYTSGQVDTLLSGKEAANANIQGHIASTLNPHSVTAAQVGAYTSGQTDTLLSGKSDTSHAHAGVYEPANSNIQGHISNTSNPHSVTAAQTGAYTTGQVDTLVQGINTELSYRPVENGFENRTDSTIAFTDGSRTFSIAPVTANYSFWSNGVKYTKTGTDQVQITDTEGLWYFYFNTSGVLQATQSFSDAIITTYAYVAMVYWDADNNQAIVLGDERHGRQMDSATHLYTHRTRGAHLQVPPGGGLSGMNVDASGDLATSAEFGYAGGVLWDEDISHVFNTTAAPAQIPIYYKSGASGAWRRKTANDFPLIYANPGTRAAYNQFTGGAWQLTEVGNNDFTLVHYFVTSNSASLVVGIAGQATYATQALATAGAKSELFNLAVSGLPTVEWTPLATVIWQTANAYNNTPKSRIRSTSDGASYVDWRQPIAGTSSGVGTGAVWGAITGTLSNQSDLVTELSGKSPTSHDHSGTYEPANANIQSHIGSTSNPHSVTAAQVGAYTSGQVDTLLTGKEAANSNIQSHIGSTSNPHSTTADQVLPDQTSKTGKVLGTNGTTASWVDQTSAAVWGSITGTLSSQTDLNSALSGKSDTGHNHTGTYEPANSNIQSHIGSTSNPHSVTADQVLPTQTGNSGKYLTTNGSASSWGTVSTGGGITDSEIIAVNTDLAASTAYLVNSSSITLTLPASPAAGDQIQLIDITGTPSQTLARNGKLIQGLAENMTMDIPGYNVLFEYLTAGSGGWWFAAQDYGTVGGVSVITVGVNATQTLGTVPITACSVKLPAAVYQAPQASVGCASASHTATVKLKQADGTVLATIGGTAGTVAWRTAGAGFTLSSVTEVDVTLESDTTAATAYLRGLYIAV